MAAGVPRQDGDAARVDDLPFDQYGRHWVVAELVRRVAAGRDLLVLDVGGSGMLLRRFLPEHRVVVADVLERPGGPGEYVRASGARLPFADRTFDLAVSTDVYEHVPAPSRAGFLRESMRVAREGVVLAAPFEGEGVAGAEAQARRLFLRLSGEEHPWLIEHLQEGLPSAAELRALIAEQGWEHVEVPNNDLVTWAWLIQFNFIEQFVPEVAGEVRSLNAHYNRALAPLDLVMPAYRRIFYLRRPDPGRPMPQPPAAEAAPLAEARIALAGSVQDVLAAMVEAIRRRDREIQRRDQEIQRLQGLLAPARRLLRIADRVGLGRLVRRVAGRA